MSCHDSPALPWHRACALGNRAELFKGDFEDLGTSYFAPSPFTHLSDADRDRITNLSRLFSLAAEFPEVRRHIRWLTARKPNAFYRHLFLVRQRWVMNHRVYNAYRRVTPVDCGTPDHFREACRELGLMLPRALP